MAQFSTGLGLAVLGGCILGAAAISSHRLGGEAFAQGTGGDRRIVSAGVAWANVWNGAGSSPRYEPVLVAHRIWSDNAIDTRVLGQLGGYVDSNGVFRDYWFTSGGQVSAPYGVWRTLDNGTSGFRPLTDVDMSGETDAGDISQVLLDFNTSSDDLPPPPIDCTINSPR
jgi:hypothetical protein